MSLAAVLLAGALVAVPGLGITFALFEPGRVSLPTRLALVFPLGYAAIALTALVLAILHALYLPALAALLVIGSALAWVTGLRRAPLRAHLNTWRREIGDERWPYLMAAALILVLVVIRLTYSPILNISDQTPLRYWADGLEMADAHRIPELSLQWGHLFPSTVSKAVLNSFDAAMSMFLGRGPFAPMGALLMLVSTGLILGAVALGREMGLRWTAPLLAILLFANRFIGNRELSADLDTYRAENWGRLLALAAVLLAVRALRSPSFRDARLEAAASGILFGVCAGTHLVPAVIGLALVICYGVGRAIADQRVVAILGTGTAVAGMAVLMGAVVLIAPRGDVGFEGTSAQDSYRRLGVELGLGEAWDPTLYLAQGKIEQAPHEYSGRFYVSPSYLYREYTRRVVGVTKVRQRYLIALPVFATMSLLLLLFLGKRDLKALAVAAVLLVAVILVVSLYFSFRYDVYAIAQFGPRRLFDYSALPFLLVGLAVVEFGLVRLGERVPRVGDPLPWLTPVASVVFLAILAIAALPKAVAPRQSYPYLASALPPLAWIQRHVPCEGRVLADRRTLATFETITRRAGVLEGMGPYLRPDVLGRAIREMLAARDFFKDPEGHGSYLRQRHISAVMVTAYNHPMGGALKVAAVDRKGLDSAPFLEEAARSASVTVYRVTDLDASRSEAFPGVRGRAGYGCGSAA